MRFICRFVFIQRWVTVKSTLLLLLLLRCSWAVEHLILSLLSVILLISQWCWCFNWVPANISCTVLIIGLSKGIITAFVAFLTNFDKHKANLDWISIIDFFSISAWNSLLPEISTHKQDVVVHHHQPGVRDAAGRDLRCVRYQRCEHPPIAHHVLRGILHLLVRHEHLLPALHLLFPATRYVTNYLVKQPFSLSFCSVKTEE